MATTHLTRIKIDPWSPDAGRDLTNAQLLHSRVLSLVPDQLGNDTRQAAGILFRLERGHHAHTLLIQSNAPLDLDTLPVGYATATDERTLTPLLTWCQTEGHLRYRIDASPTRSLATPERRDDGRRKRGRLVPLHGDDAVDWWIRKASTAGLTLNSTTLHATSQPDIVGWKSEPETPHQRSRFGKELTRFEGTATIHDPDALRTAITLGIGRSKTYGAGLLSIAPLTSP
ncbi:type I-E CRISPR-associated protein Cas6/Cse3/CasE [Streptomyces xanthochromogenes]|uniref:Type I-E CRISPR-associated protein Cas6/Cse3/CasE n=1 Tax=Streptomyces xanthochromogenes TaxID=67384 RepID=A0ABQ2ZDG9_9ACTN|nr:type I-E CRISPR-associated protein Cas6/Cse3/CasE [Streptomyces xanthochromogenes]GGY13224.1 hypothetical protein GCM10010326_00550 [Streptomyces xanthochromogenes]